MALRHWLGGLALIAGLAPAAASGGAEPGIPVRDIVRNVVPRDAIPALTRPKHTPVTEVTFLRDQDRVIAVEFAGVSLAYPTRILEHHEIVNDVVNGKPLTVSY